ncbi:hypothetical protein DL767_002737 [Monosporascus sp. MG133]|nr:hypothetical protein DL767_002737 [Monosporascus sp. MG133]
MTCGAEDGEHLDTPEHQSQVASMIKESYHDAACRQGNTPLPPPGIAAPRTKLARRLLALVQASKRAEEFTIEGIDNRLEVYREEVEAAKNDLEDVAQSFRMESERLKEETMDYLEVREYLSQAEKDLQEGKAISSHRDDSDRDTYIV